MNPYIKNRLQLINLRRSLAWVICVLIGVFAWGGTQTVSFSVNVSDYDDYAYLQVSPPSGQSGQWTKVVVHGYSVDVDIWGPGSQSNYESFDDWDNRTINFSGNLGGTISVDVYYNWYDWYGYGDSYLTFYYETSSNTPPSISVSMANPGTVYYSGNTVPFSTIASDVEGPLSKVEYYLNGSLVSTDTSSPYQYSYLNASTGSHSLYARAYDAGGLTTNSSTISFTLNSSSGSPQVSEADVTLERPVFDGIPRLGFITGYEMATGCDGIIPANCEEPLFEPYNRDSDRWWDNLVQEMVHSRIHIGFMHGRGCDNANPDPMNNSTMTGHGNMCPAHLQKMVDAIYLAGAQNIVKLAMWDDTGAYPWAYRDMYSGGTGNAVFDLSNTNAWAELIWKRNIKVWFDTIPEEMWYTHDGNSPLIAMWGIFDADFNASQPFGFSNQSGNASALLDYIVTEFQNEYQRTPKFILDQTWVSEDASIANHPHVVGINNWFNPAHNANETYTYRIHDGNYTGVLVPSFRDHNTAPGSGAPAREQLRNNGQTLRNALDAGDALVSSWTTTTLLEGMTDIAESAGFYKSSNFSWDYPNQYLNIVREYSDRKTQTTKLEAEAADGFSQSSSSSVYRTDGMNVVEYPTYGWAVSSDNGDWLEFEDLFLSKGKYRFYLKGKSESGGSKTVRLRVNGSIVATIELTTDGYYEVGDSVVGYGNHDIKVEFLDNNIELDWVFIRKIDALVAFRSYGNKYLVSERGGYDEVNANRTSKDSWEHFNLHDVNGGTLNHNDQVVLQTYNGSVLVAELGGGSTLKANRWSPGAWETFRIVKVSGSGQINSGDLVSLKTSNGRYVSAHSNGTADADATSVGSWERFTIEF